MIYFVLLMGYFLLFALLVLIGGGLVLSFLILIVQAPFRILEWARDRSLR